MPNNAMAAMSATVRALLQKALSRVRWASPAKNANATVTSSPPTEVSRISSVLDPAAQSVAEAADAIGADAGIDVDANRYGIMPSR